MPLRVDFCTHQAARYAVEHWHYSKSMPAGKMNTFGVWEDDTFVGTVVFAYGANKSIASPYKMTQQEVVELVRVAMTDHRTPVSKCVAIAIRMLKKQNPGLKLIVSYADTDQGHAGTIYKAGNWTYEGLFGNGDRSAFIINGKKVHPKTIHSKYGTGSQTIEFIRKHIDPKATNFYAKGKHKFIYPLTPDAAEMAKRLAKPYASVAQS